MNCNDCRRWIATTSLAAMPPQVRDTLERHAEQCAACANELDAARAFELRLATLEAPQVPSSLEDLIMRAVLETDEARALATQTAAEPVRSDASADAFALRALGLGAALAVLTKCLALLHGDAAFNLFVPLVQGGFEGLAQMPQHGGIAIGLATGAVLLLGGLLASIGVIELERREAR